MPNRRTHVVISEDLVAAIDRVVGKRGRSQFLAQAATLELKRREQLAALEQAAGAWKEGNHPELKDGVVSYVRRLRQETEQRFQKAARRR